VADLTGATWRKSTRSNNGGQCVEVADNLLDRGVVGVRDSKNPTGPALAVSPGAFRAFVDAVKESSASNL
jgi:hypothetical protein